VFPEIPTVHIPNRIAAKNKAIDTVCFIDDIQLALETLKLFHCQQVSACHRESPMPAIGQNRSDAGAGRGRCAFLITPEILDLTAHLA
jgi:hypothetical protein